MGIPGIPGIPDIPPPAGVRGRVAGAEGVGVATGAGGAGRDGDAPDPDLGRIPGMSDMPLLGIACFIGVAESRLAFVASFVESRGERAPLTRIVSVPRIS